MPNCFADKVKRNLCCSFKSESMENIKQNFSVAKPVVKNLNEKNKEPAAQLSYEKNMNIAHLFTDKTFDKKLPHLDENIGWFRPGEIVANPVFLDNQLDEHDIKQGLLGSCWILAPLIGLSKKQILFFRVVNPLQTFKKETYDGKFVFNFFRKDEGAINGAITGAITSASGTGRYVSELCEIDDFLPAFEYPGGKKKLAFCHNAKNENEFWGALLEKAIIKFLNMSYFEANKGGDPGVVMNLLLGGRTITQFSIPKSFDLLKNMWNNQCLMLCAILPENKDTKDSNDVVKNEVREDQLVYSHAYVVLGLKGAVKLKNPWSNGIEYSKQLGYGFLDNMADGVFSISYDDFAKNFNFLQMSFAEPSEQILNMSPTLSHFSNAELVCEKFLTIGAEKSDVPFGDSVKKYLTRNHDPGNAANGANGANSSNSSHSLNILNSSNVTNKTALKYTFNHDYAESQEFFILLKIKKNDNFNKTVPPSLELIVLNKQDNTEQTKSVTSAEYVLFTCQPKKPVYLTLSNQTFYHTPINIKLEIFKRKQ